MSARVRWACAGFALVMVAVLLWLAWSSIQVRHQSTALESTLNQTEADARALDTASLPSDLADLREQAAALESTSTGPEWWLVSWLPWIGDNIEAVQTIAHAVSSVAQSTDGLEPLLPGLSPAKLRGPTGRIDVAKLQAAEPEIARVGAAMSAARLELDEISTDDLVGPVASAVEKARSALDGAPEAMTAFGAVPALLGADGPRTYAVLLLNPAELRGGGGFFGGYAIITADHGDVTLQKVGPSDDLVRSGPLDVASLPKEYRALWGESSLEWQSVNISPNFPYAGQLTADGFAKLGLHIDAVIALDSKVAAALLAGTGPVSANGVTITSKNADAYFTKGIYAQFPDGVGHKQQVLALFSQMFVKLTTEPIDTKALSAALAPLLSQRRLLIWTTDAKTESLMAALPIGGLVPDAPGPWTTVALINGSGNKMDAYVKSRVSYLSSRCTSGSGPSTVTLQLANLAPANLPPYVDQRLDDPSAPKGSTESLAYVYGPVGSTLVSAHLDGKPVPVQAGNERGHPVWRFDVTLLRGQSRALTLTLAEPRDGRAATPAVMVQPMEIDETSAATSVACG